MTFPWLLSLFNKFHDYSRPGKQKLFSTAFPGHRNPDIVWQETVRLPSKSLPTIPQMNKAHLYLSQYVLVLTTRNEPCCFQSLLSKKGIFPYTEKTNKQTNNILFDPKRWFNLSHWFLGRPRYLIQLSTNKKPQAILKGWCFQKNLSTFSDWQYPHLLHQINNLQNCAQVYFTGRNCDANRRNL